MYFSASMSADVRAQLLSNACFRRQFGEMSVKPVKRPRLVDDATSVFELKDDGPLVRAVLLLSSEVTPTRIQESVIRAKQARSSTAPVTGEHILMPLSEGVLDGRSYAVFPFCSQISQSRFLNKIQRMMLKKSVLDWLFALTSESLLECEKTDIDTGFAQPLRRLLEEPGIPQQLVKDASLALQRLSDGTWNPYHVTMHGDFWHGNILIAPVQKVVKALAWRERFVVIDWAGSRTNGYPIFDLLRMSHSFNLKSANISHELRRYRKLLGCDIKDVRSYNATALGHMVMNLEYFSFSRFVKMANTCTDILDRALSASRG